MTREELGTLTALRNMLHGAPISQATLALRLRKLDQLLEERWVERDVRFRVRREPPLDYWEIAGKWLDCPEESE